ncbi:MAG: hypothetical protein ACRDSP_06230 [Pseudonocardiaceae bacterium]
MLTNLPALRQVGFTANRRLLGAQRLSHNPIRAEQAFTAVHDPILTTDGHRIAGLRLIWFGYAVVRTAANIMI